MLLGVSRTPISYAHPTINCLSEFQFLPLYVIHFPSEYNKPYLHLEVIPLSIHIIDLPWNVQIESDLSSSISGIL